MPLPLAHSEDDISAGERELTSFFSGVAGALSAQRKNRMTSSKALQRFCRDAKARIKVDAKRQQRRDLKEATRFNVFGLIRPDENRLSDILADLLDPRGTHGQGDLFLQLLMQKAGFGGEARRVKNAMVHREAPTYGIQKYRRRIDVLVEAGVLVAIENKVDSGEQSIQIKDYLEHLDRCTHRRPKAYVLIYLTPDCRRPESLSSKQFNAVQECGALLCWSYQTEICEWLAACREKCGASKIRHFLSDFLSYIGTHLKRKLERETEEL
jgi:hypothetical protein